MPVPWELAAAGAPQGPTRMGITLLGNSGCPRTRIQSELTFDIKQERESVTYNFDRKSVKYTLFSQCRTVKAVDVSRE